MIGSYVCICCARDEGSIECATYSPELGHREVDCMRDATATGVDSCEDELGARVSYSGLKVRVPEELSHLSLRVGVSMSST